MHPMMYSILRKSPRKPSLLAVASRLVTSSSVAPATMGSSRRYSNTCLGGGGAPSRDCVSFKWFPGIMVPGTDENSETREFLHYNPFQGYRDSFQHFYPYDTTFEKIVDSKPLPVPHRYACHGSAYGWVFLVGDELDTKLMNPFTGEEIQLPSIRTLPPPYRGWTRLGINKMYVLKAVFSSDPSLQPAPLVMVIHRGHYPRLAYARLAYTRLAYCKPGDVLWTSLHLRNTKHSFEDAIFFQDQFYAICQPGYIMAYDIGRRTDDNNHSVRETLVASEPDDDDHSVKQTLTASESKGPVMLEDKHTDLYLVVLNGELIKVARIIWKGKDWCVTGKFIFQRFVTSENKWVNVESLGDHALFLGKNTSFSLPAGTLVPNAIYFTDGSIKDNEPYVSDMGIYSVSDRFVAPLYPIGSGLTLPPPVFVTKPNMSRAADIPILSSGQQSPGDDNGDVHPALQSKTPAPIQTSSQFKTPATT